MQEPVTRRDPWRPRRAQGSRLCRQAEDCGTSQGNNKDNDGNLINDWLLEGILGSFGAELDCSEIP
jgi:hypothetical protein